MKKWTYTFGVMDDGSNLMACPPVFGEVEILSVRAKTTLVGREQCTGYNEIVPNDRLFDTKSEAMAHARPRAQRCFDWHCARAAEFMAAVVGTLV